MKVKLPTFADFTVNHYSYIRAEDKKIKKEASMSCKAKADSPQCCLSKEKKKEEREGRKERQEAQRTERRKNARRKVHILKKRQQ